MSKRKLIALIASEIYDGYQDRLIEGAVAQATSLGYNVAIFSVISKIDTAIPMCIGQERIYELLNLDMVDGVILAQETFRNHQSQASIQEHLRKRCKVPIVSLSDFSDYFPYSSIDDVRAFKKIALHLIKEHGAKKLYCLTGFKEFDVSTNRANGFLQALTENNLPIDENTIIYGDFWKPAAIELAHKIIDGTIPMPDAVVCANDIMAINLCNTLCENGVDVPGKVRITGYDAVHDAFENIPAITTYWRPLYTMAANGVCMLHELITGEKCANISEEQSDILPGESCGCHRANSFSIEKLSADRIKHQAELDYECSYMAQYLTSAKCAEECFERLDGFTYLIEGIDVFALCLCDNWDNIADENGFTLGLPETMNLKLFKRKNVALIRDDVFDTKLMLPQLWEDSEKPAAFFFAPINFNERFFGYTVITYNKNGRCYDKIFRDWNLNAGNAFEYICSQEKLRSLYRQVYLSSVRDALTGIYNRMGFNTFAADIFDSAKKNGHKLLLVAADLDYLKTVNDEYGHPEGDNALIIASQALNTACYNNEICARTGGDEYTVIGSVDYSDTAAEEYITRVNSYLERYNASSGKPYKVLLSLGYFFDTLEAYDTLWQLISYTDQLMYANKKLRKAERKA